jgi:diacylglycerol kinase (ATP)
MHVSPPHKRAHEGRTASQPPVALGRKQRFHRWWRAMIHGFGYAFVGIVDLVRVQRNAQVHVFVIAVLVLVSLAWGLSPTEWLVLILTMSMVLAMEAINTAVEAVVDLVSPDYHPLAKRAKDVAAGGVLITAIGAVFVALIIFGPRLLALASAVFA